MGRYCAQCGDWCSANDFSSNQFRKGAGVSRCRDCVGGSSYHPQYQCGECHRVFANQNELNMHLQVHRPRSVACPICHERRFRSGANAVQHVESGYCSGCRGTQNARDSIYKFAQRQQSMQPYLTSRPMLTNGSHRQGGTPDFPYRCHQCQKSFRQASQLLQHNDAKHGQTRLLAY